MEYACQLDCGTLFRVWNFRRNCGDVPKFLEKQLNRFINWFACTINLVQNWNGGLKNSEGVRGAFGITEKQGGRKYVSENWRIDNIRKRWTKKEIFFVYTWFKIRNIFSVYSVLFTLYLWYFWYFFMLLHYPRYLVHQLTILR